jgi:hypothetical protein
MSYQEINASEYQKLYSMLVRSDGEAVVVNLPNIKSVEKPEDVRWVARVDPTRPYV